MRISRQIHRGFTLIEVMVAVALLVVVVGAIYASWLAILRASRTGVAVAETAQRERLSIQIMEEALNSTLMYAANGKWYWFAAENGSDASISFVARLGKSFPRSGKFGDLDVRRVTFALEPGTGMLKQLVLRQSPLLMEMDEDEERNPLVLAQYVKELRFDFWDAQNAKWLDEWNNTNTIPKIVLISLKLGVPDAGMFHSDFTRQMIRIVNMPSVGVQPVWQSIGAQRPGAIAPTNQVPGGVNLTPPPAVNPGVQQ